jgi:hypothetical protein
MLNPFATIPAVRFSDSNFLSKGIPEVVFHAQRYMRLSDTCAGREAERLEATRLLSSFKQEIERNIDDMPQVLLSNCMQEVAYDRGAIRQLTSRAPKIISTAMKSKAQISLREMCYCNPAGPIPTRQQQLQEFRADLIQAVNSVTSATQASDTYTNDAAAIVLDLAVFVSNYFERVADRTKLLKDLARPADHLASLMSSSQDESGLVVRFCISLLARELAESAEKAALCLSKRLAGSSPRLAAKVVEAAKEPPLLSLGSLSDAEKQHLCNSLKVALSDPKLLHRSLLLPALLKADSALREHHAVIRGCTPEWLRICAMQGRLDTRDFAAFAKASEKLKAHLGTASTVSIDVGLYSWPRITEIAAITRPKEILLHSDLPRNTEGESSAFVSRYIAEALAVRANSFLPFMSLAPSLESVIDTERKWLQPAAHRDADPASFAYLTSEGLRRAQIVLKTPSTVADRISKLLNGKPVTVPCFIVEGASEQAPRAFGVLFDNFERDAQGYNREKLGGITIYSAQSDLVRRSQPRAQSSAAMAAPKPASPPVEQPTVAITDEMKLAAMEAIEVAQRFKIETHERALEPLMLLKQVVAGKSPKRKALRIRESMAYDLKRSKVTGGVAALYEKAIPVLNTVAEELERQ